MLRSLLHSFIVALVAAILITLWINFNILDTRSFVSSSMSSITGHSDNGKHLVQVALIVMVIVWVSSFSDKIVTKYVTDEKFEKEYQ